MGIFNLFGGGERHDRNYFSYDTEEQVGDGDRVFNPLAAGWEPGSWSDTVKFWKRQFLVFYGFDIVGGNEDCVDATGTKGCLFKNFWCHANGSYVLTLKGNSNSNVFMKWHVHEHGKVCDIQVGGWYSYGTGRSKGNVFDGWTSEDGGPITYSYRLGCKPTLIDMNAKHLWWLSAGLTVHWWFKWFIHKVLRIKD